MNSFYEFTMVNPKNLSQYVGFTEEEVRRLCVAYDMDYDNYWGQTESYESLKEYICMNYDGPKDSIFRMKRFGQHFPMLFRKGIGVLLYARYSHQVIDCRK